MEDDDGMAGMIWQAEGLSLEHVTIRPARALLARPDGSFYVGRHFRVYRSSDGGGAWSHVASLPRPFSRKLAEMSRLATRLLRHEVKALEVLSDGTHVATNRSWVFFGPPGETMMTPSKVNEDGQTLAPPMTMTVGPAERILFGEYNSKTAHNEPVRLFVSDDGGRCYEIARVFEGGSILHIHKIVYDVGMDHYWILAGDHGNEPGIGRLSADLKDFEWVVKGDQAFRAVEVFDFGDHLIYGMDSEKTANAVMRLEKATGRVERLQEIDGSCIYACRFGALYVLSTTVEPSRVNHSTAAGLWVSRDGDRWKRVLRAEKDFWHPVYFQYGSLVLPRGVSEEETILFSGQALKGLDGRACAARWRDGLSAGPSIERAASMEDGNQTR